jgi:alkaline phosphatase D
MIPSPFRPRALSAFAALALFLRPAAAAHVDLVAGPMVGHVTENSARIWMQFPIAGQVGINVIDARTNQTVSGVKVDLEGPSPFACDVPVNNLRPDRSYRLEVKFEGDPVTLPAPDLVIRTAPSPGDESPLTIAFGSDIAPPPPGAAKGPAALFKAITDLKPRAFFFLGNVGYLPPSLNQFPTTRRAAYRFICDLHDSIRREPFLQPLFRTTPSYGLFNDRDFGTLDADQSFPFAQESLIAYQKFWPNPDWGTPQTPGCFSTCTFGDVDFFLLDTRTYRTPSSSAATQPAAAALLGPGQLDWLKKSLLASRASFKVLAAPCPLFSDEPDSWARFPAEQPPFLRWLGDHHISGLLALAGNRPAGELTRVDPPRAAGVLYPLFTLGTSTLTDIPGRAPPTLLPNPQRLAQPVLQNNFGTLDFGGQREHRLVTLRLRDESGKTRLEQILYASQLRAP